MLLNGTKQNKYEYAGYVTVGDSISAGFMWWSALELNFGGVPFFDGAKIKLS